jgi:hypothetical protein
VASTNTHTVLVHNNTFTNVGIAAELFSSRGGPTVSTVTSNVITGVAGNNVTGSSGRSGAPVGGSATMV